MHRLARSIPKLARLTVLAIAGLPLTGCYLLQAAQGQMQLTARRAPIASVLENPATPASLKTRLEYVTEARNFASRELGLPDNDSYRSYADVQRPYVVWNVFATDEFSVEPRRWCFPIAGCVVYRGYFNEHSAQRYARGLRLKGYDTAVGGVSAYSTLGHFKDPVLNTMMGWSDAQLAGTLFHELAHQVLYVPGDSEFNEAFATTVEEAGLERWLNARGKSNELRAWQAQRERSHRFVDLLLEARERLRTLYSLKLAPDAMRARKNAEFGRLKFEYAQLKASWGGYGGYDTWFDRTLTNAHLVTAATYHGCVPGFRKLLASVDGDLPRFYEAARQLSKDELDRRRGNLCGQTEEREAQAR